MKNNYIINKLISESFVWLIVNYIFAILLLVSSALPKIDFIDLFPSILSLMITLTITFTLTYSNYYETSTDKDPYSKLTIILTIFVVATLIFLFFWKYTFNFNLINEKIKSLYKYLMISTVIYCYLLCFKSIKKYVEEESGMNKTKKMIKIKLKGKKMETILQEGNNV